MESITNSEMGRSRPLLMVADVSCDIGGSVEFLLQSTTLDQPFFVYDPLTRKAYDDLGMMWYFEEGGVVL